jgi:hypothetical protein
MEEVHVITDKNLHTLHLVVLHSCEQRGVAILVHLLYQVIHVAKITKNVSQLGVAIGHWMVKSSLVPLICDTQVTLSLNEKLYKSNVP